MENNNLSRKLFKEFLVKNPSVKRVDSRNIFTDVFGDNYAFCMIAQDRIECRQFYEGCVGIVCLDARTNKLVQIEKEELKIDASPNRITAKGVRAFTARGHFIQSFVPMRFVF